MKLIDKMLMECKPTLVRLHLAIMTVMPGGSVMMQCCFANEFGMEVSRCKCSYKDKQVANDMLEELLNQYLYEERPVIILDDIMDVAYCDPT